MITTCWKRPSMSVFLEPSTNSQNNRYIYSMTILTVNLWTNNVRWLCDCVLVGLLFHTSQWRRWTPAATWNTSQSSRYATLLWNLLMKLYISSHYFFCSATSNLLATHVASMSSITWSKQWNYYVWKVILRYISQFKTHSDGSFLHAVELKYGCTI